MPPSRTTSRVQSAISALKSYHDGREHKRRQWKALRRGYDPRDTELRATKTSRIEDAKRLKTNDPVTYFNLAVHMLSSRDINFHIETLGSQKDEEREDAGKAERALRSLIQQNDERLIRSGRYAANRMLADSGCEVGVMAVMKRWARRGDTYHFFIDPIDPEHLLERFDDDGLAEIAYSTTKELSSLEAEAEFREGWNVQALRELRGRKANQSVFVTVQEYYRRDYRLDGQPIVKHATLVEGKPLLGDEKSLGVDEGDTEIPLDVAYANGEAFSRDLRFDDVKAMSHRSQYRGQSILEPNVPTYTGFSDFLKDLHTHMQEVLTAPVDEYTVGGRPVADPATLDPERGRSTTSYDSARGERGRQTVNINQISPAVQFLFSDYSGQLQRGSVPHLLHGNIQFQLSGFAISQIKKGALSALGNVAIALEQLWSRIADWILRTIKENNLTIQSHGFSTRERFAASTARREYFFDGEFGRADIPDRYHVNAQLELDLPSDLTERVNIAQILDRSGRPILNRVDIGEEVLPDIIRDPKLNDDEIDEQEIAALPEVQLLRMSARLRRRAREVSDPSYAQELNDLADLYRQQATSRQGTQGQGTSQQIEPTALSTPARNGNVPQPNAGPNPSSA